MKEIPLTQGQVALVDDEDFEAMSKFKWFADKRRRTYYAARNLRVAEGRGKRTVHMHAELLRVDGYVDHKDGNGLNNQRYNLRPATTGQNVINSAKRRTARTSSFKGVYLHKSTGKWMARLAGKFIGYFDSEIDAAKAYNAAALAKYGEFAKVNPV